MSAGAGPDERVALLLETATQAQSDGNFETGIETFAQAILLRGGVRPPEGYQEHRLPQGYGKLVGSPVLVAEVALPSNVVGWNVQRVSVGRLEERRGRTPGLHISERFRSGLVDVTITGTKSRRNVSTVTTGHVREAESRDVASPAEICRVLNLAAHEGTVVPPERIGKKSLREYVRTAAALVGNLITDMMTVGKED